MYRQLPQQVLISNLNKGTRDLDLPLWIEALVFIRRFGDGQGAPGADSELRLSARGASRKCVGGRAVCRLAPQAYLARERSSRKRRAKQRWRWKCSRIAAGSYRHHRAARDSSAADVLLDRDGSVLGPTVGRHTVFWKFFVLYNRQRMLAPTAAAAGQDLLYLREPGARHAVACCCPGKQWR